MRYSLKYIFLFIILIINVFYPINLYSQDILRDSLFIERKNLPEIENEYTFYNINRNNSFYTGNDMIVIDPIFMPVVFTGKVLPDNHLTKNPYQLPSLSNVNKFIPSYMKPDSSLAFPEIKIQNEIRNKSYEYLTYYHPELIKYSHLDMPKEKEVSEKLENNAFKELFKVESNNPDFSSFGTPNKYLFRKYWIFSGNSLLQFSQNYISENWNKGGVGNLNILSNQNMRVKYAKDKIEFSTYLEWNTSLYTNPNDSLRKTKIGTDLLRTYSDFGIRAFNKRWFYSSNLEVKTQVFNNYKENTQTKISAFMSPLFVNMGVLGMRYELDKKYKSDKYKQLKLSTDISLLSVKYTYVKNKEVDPKRYGIPQGENHLLDLGSMINSTLTFNITRYTSFKSRFKYFTNFEKIEVESENEINFAINRYFSTRVYLYLRFDDSENIPKDPKLGYIQLNELLSFGFNYRW